MNVSGKAVVVMGVSGCGKTTVGQLLADRLGWEFVESDLYHSQEDIRKMSSGIPLSDDDRWPWLKHLNEVIRDAQQREQPVVVACSALKQQYRNLLSSGIEGLIYIYLKGDYELIYSRMKLREHFMEAGMLASQFEILEEPSDALVVDINQPPEKIVNYLLEKLIV